MPIYEKILKESVAVDTFWENFSGDYFSNVKINFGRYFLYTLPDYETFLKTLQKNNGTDFIILVDQNLVLPLVNGVDIIKLLPSEKETKNIDFIEKFVLENKNKLQNKLLVAVGGGVILDTCLCIAEKLQAKIFFVPTTVLSMSDSSIGGKARANKFVEVGAGAPRRPEQYTFLKHFYKSYYEPKEIVICENFLQTLPEKTIAYGCAEIIKHAFLQSEKLLGYLLSDNFQPFTNRKSLLKAILWKVDLHRVCLEVDPAETAGGSKEIIREGHDFSDNLEKSSGFTISHGEAVLRGMKNDFEKKSNLMQLEKFTQLCEKLRISL